MTGPVIVETAGGRDLRPFADDIKCVSAGSKTFRRSSRRSSFEAPPVREGWTSPVIHFVLLIACAVAIYFSCEWFVNAVEGLGERLNVGKMAVGTILAAFGTALPESVVTLGAVTTGATEEAKNIGVGAAMGGPLALATVAYGVTGTMLLLKRRKERAALLATVGGGGSDVAPPDSDALGGAKDLKRLAKDQQWFLPIFIVKVALGLVAFAFKPTLGLLFFAAYAVYFWREIRSSKAAEDDEDEDDEELEPLKFQPGKAAPATWAVVAQTLATLAVIFFAAHFFVKQLDVIGPMLGLSATVTALLLSPIATELPEIMNAVIWVRQG
ncbi:sodium:calcium antiporter [Streptomyces sp. NPDC057636]|uniref:sodium:calcium antiporter n=1 Tax=Streptomyces sp. NPDC057636 TaxID=3346189 RepID=UPI0036D1ABAD